MPETAKRASKPVPPRLIISKPIESASSTSGKSIAGLSPRSKEPKRSTASDWSDIDESPPRRRRSKEATGQRQARDTKASSSSSQIGLDKRASESTGFLPRLGKILEVNESTTSLRSSNRGSEKTRRHSRSSTKHTRYRDEVSSNHRRPTKHKVGAVRRRDEVVPNANPSLLSVLSTLTSSTDRSSGTSSTLTQETYNRRMSEPSTAHSGKARRMESELRSNMAERSSTKLPNVFDYMEPDEDHDSRSVHSSSSSHYEPSDAGSSVASDTPSSRSTVPSPTSTRSGSVADLRKKYDPQYATSTGSARSNSNSPEPSIRSFRKCPSVSDVPEDEEEEDSAAPSTEWKPSHQPQRPSSRSSHGSASNSERLQQQEEALRQHVAYMQQGHYVEPVYDQHRSFSNSSAHSERSAHAYHMAMQQYQWPSPPPIIPAPAPTPAMNGHIVPTEHPEAPAAPDLNRRTLTGYEELALELASATSPVKPLYRKFEYLNHRILLHLQDELSELEEQLRTLDEIIAQMNADDGKGKEPPASRRRENSFGSDIYLRRTHLLGNIFVKTEQYNRAMASYASMIKDSTPANEHQVTVYRRWMASHSPVDEAETRFLQHDDDLMLPAKELGRPAKYEALSYPVAAFMVVVCIVLFGV